MKVPFCSAKASLSMHVTKAHEANIDRDKDEDKYEVEEQRFSDG
jgi:hypothetical protein